MAAPQPTNKVIPAPTTQTVSGTIVSRVNYPVTLGKGENAIILPPHGRFRVLDINIADPRSTEYAIIGGE